jgi:hypothetical protein
MKVELSKLERHIITNLLVTLEEYWHAKQIQPQLGIIQSINEKLNTDDTYLAKESDRKIIDSFVPPEIHKLHDFYTSSEFWEKHKHLHKKKL